MHEHDYIWEHRQTTQDLIFTPYIRLSATSEFKLGRSKDPECEHPYLLTLKKDDHFGGYTIDTYPVNNEAYQVLCFHSLLIHPPVLKLTRTTPLAVDNNAMRAEKNEEHRTERVRPIIAEVVPDLAALWNKAKLSPTMVEGFTQLVEHLRFIQDYINYEHDQDLTAQHQKLRLLVQNLQSPHIEFPLIALGRQNPTRFEAVLSMARRVVESGYVSNLEPLISEDDLDMVLMYIGDARDHLALATALFEGRFQDAESLTHMDTASRDYIPEEVWTFIHSDEFKQLKLIEEGQQLETALEQEPPTSLPRSRF